MPHPKRRHSKTRRDKRRGGHSNPPANVISCPNCGSPMQSHRVCEECGYYRGKPAITPKAN